jgi:AcrR family transcriptional regulator
MTPARSTLSTADTRRAAVADAAITEFAAGGYAGTTIAAVGARVGISSAYVFKLFPSKTNLFVTALERCFDLVLEALAEGVDGAPAGAGPVQVLDAMGAAYADLIADRRLIMVQVHAQSATDLPEVRAALRAGLARVVAFASSRSGASDAEVQRFLAFGQLCHLIVTADIDALASTETWAGLVTRGIRHPGPVFPDDASAEPHERR